MSNDFFPRRPLDLCLSFLASLEMTRKALAMTRRHYLSFRRSVATEKSYPDVKISRGFAARNDKG